MKTIFVFCAVAAAAATAFGQGKVNLINDAASLVTDVSSGQPIGNTTPLPSGITLVAGLYGGTSAGNLFLYSTYTMNSSAPGTAGVLGPLHIVLNALPNGAPAIPGIANNTPVGASTPWFQVRVWDNRYPTYEASLSLDPMWTGEGAPFQMNPGSSVAYVNTSPSANSTWTDGPIYVGWPEPSTAALMALGLGILGLRRKNRSRAPAEFMNRSVP